MPNWIGDAVMATPALKNLQNHFFRANFYLVCSAAVGGLFTHDPSIKRVFIDNSKKSFFRLRGISFLAREIQEKVGIVDLAFTFQNNFPSAWLLYKIRAKEIYGARVKFRDIFLTKGIKIDKTAHQAQIYNEIVNKALGLKYETGDTTLFVKQVKKPKVKRCGINAGSTYGSAKRWEAHKFAEVSLELSQEYEIIIFGTADQRGLTQKIESVLIFNGVKNYRNLTGKTSIYELLSEISQLSLFITNDSGPMHIAGAFKVPSVCIFGSTNFKQTHQWNNQKSIIVRKDMDCSPCMKRNCPLAHHKCMRDIKPSEVIEAAREVV